MIFLFLSSVTVLFKFLCVCKAFYGFGTYIFYFGSIYICIHLLYLHLLLTLSSRQYHVLPHENYHSRQGGSLERGTTTRIKISSSGSNHTQTYAASDSEYGHYGGSGTARNSRSSCSPSSTRKYNQHTNGVVVAPGTSSPSNTSSPSSPNTCGSKSLPKGASSLNYGLMMDKIQQKRHQRQQIQQYTPKINDGSLSDSNYVTYDQTNR